MATKQEYFLVKTSTPGILGHDDVSVGLKCAQIFTLGTTGDNFSFTLKFIEMNLKKAGAPTGNATFKIYEIYPDEQPNDDETEISSNSSSFDVADLTTNGRWYKIDMSSATLVKGKTYALVIFYDTGSVGNILHINGKGIDEYAGGDFWHTKNGVVWTKNGDADLAFTINGGDYTGTLATLAECVDKAGALASTISTNEILINQFALDAEAYICCVTRYNWVDAYSTLNTTVRRILTGLCTDLVAINAITYDMSGYTDITEAETMLNVYRESVMRGTSLLRDQKVKVFITGE